MALLELASLVLLTYVISGGVCQTCPLQCTSRPYPPTPNYPTPYPPYPPYPYPPYPYPSYNDDSNTILLLSKAYEKNNSSGNIDYYDIILKLINALVFTTTNCGNNSGNGGNNSGNGGNNSGNGGNNSGNGGNNGCGGSGNNGGSTALLDIELLNKYCSLLSVLANVNVDANIDVL